MQFIFTGSGRTRHTAIVFFPAKNFFSPSLLYFLCLPLPLFPVCLPHPVPPILCFLSHSVSLSIFLSRFLDRRFYSHSRTRWSLFCPLLLRGFFSFTSTLCWLVSSMLSSFFSRVGAWSRAGVVEARDRIRSRDRDTAKQCVPWVVALFSLSFSLRFSLSLSLSFARIRIHIHTYRLVHTRTLASPTSQFRSLFFSFLRSRAQSRTSAVSPLPTIKDHDRPLRFKFLSGWTERSLSGLGTATFLRDEEKLIVSPLWPSTPFSRSSSFFPPFPSFACFLASGPAPSVLLTIENRAEQEERILSIIAWRVRRSSFSGISERCRQSPRDVRVGIRLRFRAGQVRAANATFNSREVRR